MNTKAFFLLLALYLSIAGAVKVINMPWWPTDYPTKFDFYSDNLQTASPNRTIHYVLLNQTTQAGASQRPLVLWLNGGPGCSSLLGLLQEIGPFVMDDLEGNFTLFNNSAYNPHSWLNDADLLFFETPPGVGFSENNDTTYNYTDNNTASDSYSALVNFLTQFPEFVSRNFFIAGESYAGMYVPYLAWEITKRNALNTSSIKVNLKGILVGNGVAITSPDSVLNDDTNRFLSYHKIFSPQLDNTLFNVCPADPNSASCIDAMNQAQQLTTYVNPYDIFRYCNYLNHPFEPKFAEKLLENSAPRAAFKFGGKKQQGLMTSVQDEIRSLLEGRILSGDNSTNSTSNSTSGPVLKDGGSISCQNSPQVINYLNVPEVKKALNVNPNIRWSDCNNAIFPQYQRDPSGSQWIYDRLRGQIKVTVFSGDTDSVVPWTHTERWIKNLNIQVKEAWRPWYSSNQQIGGYITVYDGIDFVTVRGAGHMVPQWRREEARLLFKSFINGTRL